MSSKEQAKEIRAFYGQAMAEIQSLVSAATEDLYNGPSGVDEDYPGFATACRAIRDWCDENVSTLYVTECDGVFDREPTLDDECETCENSGYVWPEDEHGQTWMSDCPNDECNAFGQFDPQYSEVEPREIIKILFGAQLAQYL